MAEDSQEPPQDIATKCEIVDVSSEVVKPTDDDVKAPEEKWKELGLTNELQAGIQKAVSDLGEQPQDTPEEDNKPKDVVYPPIAEPTEKETPITIDDLRVNLEVNPQQSFTYVNTSMGVKYD